VCAVATLHMTKTQVNWLLKWYTNSARLGAVQTDAVRAMTGIYDRLLSRRALMAWFEFQFVTENRYLFAIKLSYVA
jgi:hypothetical protein